MIARLYTSSGNHMLGSSMVSIHAVKGCSFLWYSWVYTRCVLPLVSLLKVHPVPGEHKEVLDHQVCVCTHASVQTHAHTYCTSHTHSTHSYTLSHTHSVHSLTHIRTQYTYTLSHAHNTHTYAHKGNYRNDGIYTRVYVIFHDAPLNFSQVVEEMEAHLDWRET